MKARVEYQLDAPSNFYVGSVNWGVVTEGVYMLTAKCSARIEPGSVAYDKEEFGIALDLEGNKKHVATIWLKAETEAEMGCCAYAEVSGQAYYCVFLSQPALQKTKWQYLYKEEDRLPSK